MCIISLEWKKINKKTISRLIIRHEYHGRCKLKAHISKDAANYLKHNKIKKCHLQFVDKEEITLGTNGWIWWSQLEVG